MKTIIISHIMPELLPLQFRSPGPHISHIIDELCIERGDYTRREKDSPQAQALFQIGHAIEHAIVYRWQRTWPNRYIQPGECQKDNIFFTPDLWDMSNIKNPRYPGAIRPVHEIKSTRLKMQGDLSDDKYWRYVCQLMSYCYGLGVNHGVLSVVFLRGDYGNQMVGYLEQLFKWSDEELEANWGMLATKGKIMEREGYWVEMESKESFGPLPKNQKSPTGNGDNSQVR